MRFNPLLKLRGSASDDVKNVDLTKIHNLSGPIAVEGAEPGDCLVVDILDSKFCPTNFVLKNCPIPNVT